MVNYIQLFAYVAIASMDVDVKRNRMGQVRCMAGCVYAMLTSAQKYTSQE